MEDLVDSFGPEDVFVEELIFIHVTDGFLDCIGGLLLGADKENALAVCSKLTDEVISLFHLLDGLLQVYDVDAVGGNCTIGSAANECNMLPVTVSLCELPGVVTGSVVTLYLSFASTIGHTVAVPRTALVEEMGNIFVFVQNNPVSFEKRSVKVGETDGRYVQVLSGIEPGERVVSKGGIILKLSQGAAALDPHAGHVH